MTRQQTRIVVAALVVTVLLLMIALTADGAFPPNPRDGRGLSAATATLYGAIIAGVFTLLGVGAERLIQRRGRVRCVMELIRLWVIATREDDLTVRTLPLPAGAVDEELAEQYSDHQDNEVIRYLIDAKLFNEKEVKIGIRDVVLVFEGRRETLAVEVRERGVPGSYSPDVNLPTREWVPLVLIGLIGREDARKLTHCDEAWLRGYYPDGRLFSVRVPTQGA